MRDQKTSKKIQRNKLKRLREKGFLTQAEVLRRLYPDAQERIQVMQEIEKRSEELHEEYLEELASKLRCGRKRSEMTQSELAKKMGTTASVISRIENGKQNLTIEYIVKLCKAIGRPFRIDVEIF